MVTPSLLILLTISIAIINLFAIFITINNRFTNYLLTIIISVCFFINVIVLDWSFLNGVRAYLHIISFGSYSIDFYLESIGLVFLNLLGFLWPCALVYTTQYLKINKIANQSQFLFFLNFSILSGILVALSANLFSTFVFYEILTLCTIPLINHEKTSATQKGLYKYLKILLISSITLFLPAIIIIYTKIGHGDFIYRGIIAAHFSNIQSIILLLMFIFGISKVALFPLHGWLPAAMVASYPVSALLHAVLVVKVGLFCIYKVILYTFGLKYLESLFPNYNWIIIFPIFTILYSSIKALRVDNVKMVLAYSTINHLSIALLSSFMFTPKAIGAAVLHLLSHSLNKICLFYTAGNMYSLNKIIKLNDLSGISKTMPKNSLIFLIASISLIGIPPFGGFISKFYIMLAAAEHHDYLVLITVASSSVLTALYMLKVLLLIYKPEPIVTDNPNVEINLPKLMLYSVSLCLFMVVIFFIINKLISQFLLYIY